MQNIELFAGCGGLAYGMEKAGFTHAYMVEKNKDAYETLKINIEIYGHSQIVCGDVRDVDWSQFKSEIHLVTGGPPCQPFSIGGKKKGQEDSRDMWPETIRAIREIEPKAFIFENVSNLVSQSFADYLNWILLSLRNPDILICKNRLSKNSIEQKYSVHKHVVNAADYGAAQIRKRVIISGLKTQANIHIDIQPSHSENRLLYEQWISGEYWKRHEIPKPFENELPIQIKNKILKLRNIGIPKEQPWRTVRDALMSLGHPNGINGHVLKEGARSYKGHTGSSMDMPAKALKAGTHGVPGGENMLLMDNGKLRYFTIREAARLTGFPDTYIFNGTHSTCLRQMGNAVPVELSYALGQAVSKALL